MKVDLTSLVPGGIVTTPGREQINCFTIKSSITRQCLPPEDFQLCNVFSLLRNEASQPNNGESWFSFLKKSVTSECLEFSPIRIPR